MGIECRGVYVILSEKKIAYKKKSQVIRKPIVIEILWRIIIVFWDTTSNKNIFNAFVAKNILKLFSINTLVKENSCTLQLWVCFKLIFIVYELYYQLKFYINLYLFEFRKLLLYLSVCEKVYIPPHKYKHPFGWLIYAK